MKKRSHKLNMTGRRFGMLTVVEFAGVKGSAQHAAWRCVCDCGNETVAVGASMRAGRTQSCGCLSAETRFTSKYALKHGRSGSRTHSIWAGMHERCRNANGRKAHLYALKGIRVCERWSDFSLFLEDMGEAPAGMTLDRIDGERGYSKENCRWATPKQQANNTSANHLISFNGETKTLSIWADELGIKSNTLLCRIRRGVPLELAMQPGTVNVRTEAKRSRTRKCLVCGADFIPRPAQLRAGSGKFCSHACSTATRAKNPITGRFLADVIELLSKEQA